MASAPPLILTFGRVDPQLLYGVHWHYAEGLIYFPKIDIFYLQVGIFQCLFRGRYGALAHGGWLNAGNAE
jgi:hypothetical protein